MIDARTRYLSGLAAEDAVEAEYLRDGMTLIARRWRGPGGEIDLIFRDGPALIFVEVKRAATFEAAAARVLPRQMERICASATAFLAAERGGQDTEMRIDVALVDAMGRTQRLENAFGG